MRRDTLPTRRSVASLLFVLFFAVSCSAPNAQETGIVQTRIHDIQGCAHISPFSGKIVQEISGIVTWKTTKGFYLQDDQMDALDCSSEAIFVFTNAFSQVLPGDRVVVSGKVEEFAPGNSEDHNLTITEITRPKIRVITHGNLLPGAVVIGDNGRQLPGAVVDDDFFLRFDVENDGIDFYESLESMLVQIDDGIVVGPRNSYNEVVIIPQNDLTQNVISAAGSLLDQENDLNPERIMLNLNQSSKEIVNVGARLMHPVQGIVDYSYGNYKVNVFGNIEFSDSQPQIFPVPREEAALSIASYNTENLSRFDNNSRFDQIADIIVKRLRSPDIILLHEVMDDSGIEDDGTVSAEFTIQKIIAAISGAKGPVYTSIQLDPVDGSDGGIPGGNIRSVILFRTDTGVDLVKDAFIDQKNSSGYRIGETSSCFEGTRKPIAALFEKNGKNILIVGAHLTSLGADSPVYGNLQPMARPEEGKRICQADTIRRYVDEYINTSPNFRVVVAGDLNDTPWSDTVRTLTASTLSDMGTTIPKNERYSYILDGNAVQMDYILINNAVDNGDQFMIPHTNSIFDHTLQSSDHDPVFALIEIE